eukprot:gene7925-8121_t
MSDAAAVLVCKQPHDRLVGLSTSAEADKLLVTVQGDGVICYDPVRLATSDSKALGSSQAQLLAPVQLSEGQYIAAVQPVGSPHGLLLRTPAGSSGHIAGLSVSPAGHITLQQSILGSGSSSSQLLALPDKSGAQAALLVGSNVFLLHLKLPRGDLAGLISQVAVSHGETGSHQQQEGPPAGADVAAVPKQSLLTTQQQLNLVGLAAALGTDGGAVDGVEATAALRDLPTPAVLGLLKYLAKWVTKYSRQSLTGSQVQILDPLLSAPSWSQTLDWLTMLLDATFTRLAMHPAAVQVLTQLQHLLQQEVGATSKLVSLKGAGDHLAMGAPLPAAAEAASSAYTLELLDLRVVRRH